MEEKVAAILTRRSIRLYQDRPVEEEKVELLLKAAMAAPSAGNEQPWEYVVITDRKLMREVMKIHPHAEMLEQASVAIMVCANMERCLYKEYWVQDCAAAMENLLVAANALGLGSVWLGCYPREERVKGLRKLFGLPETVIPFSIAPVGYPAEEKPPADRYEEGRVHRNGW